MQTVGMTIYAVDQIYTICMHMMYTYHLTLLFRRHVNDDSKYYVNTVSDKLKLNIKR